MQLDSGKTLMVEAKKLKQENPGSAAADIKPPNEGRKAATESTRGNGRGGRAGGRGRGRGK